MKRRGFFGTMIGGALGLLGIGKTRPSQPIEKPTWIVPGHPRRMTPSEFVTFITNEGNDAGVSMVFRNSEEIGL